MNWIASLLRSDDGTTAVEYAVLLAMILAVIIGAITSLGQGNGGMWGNNSSALQSAFGS